MIEKRLKELWENLQGKKPQMPDFLHSIRLRGFRGIDDLRIILDYPVCVLAGENAVGKSTMLFAAACAYWDTEYDMQDYAPGVLFPDYIPTNGGLSDERPEVIIECAYTTKHGSATMHRKWKKGGHGFLDAGSGTLPERAVYIHTLSKLSDMPKERDMRQMSRSKTPPQPKRLNIEQIDFAQKLLGVEYEEVVNLSGENQNILFARNKNGALYSEFHMSSGERTALRLSLEIGHMKDALVLIDEVDAGLHPWAQKLLMLHLQKLALRNNLQIIVTTHSLVVLKSVPQNARIFLARDDQGKVVARPAYRDIIQNALYGHSHDKINLLCEDRAAESILQGVMDILAHEQNIIPGTVCIGRDTGAREFPGHATAFGKFGLLANFVFVLDGDQREQGVAEKLERAANKHYQHANTLFLPGDSAPEKWVWDCLQNDPAFWSKHLGAGNGILEKAIQRNDAHSARPSNKPGNNAKQKLADLADKLSCDVQHICRTVARLEAEEDGSELRVLVNKLKCILLQWRAG